MAAFDAEHWDDRYRAADLVWGAGPNQFVQAECVDLLPGRAVDLGCGEGRNGIWLAAHGWDVTGVDFSAVALEKAAKLTPARTAVSWLCADVVTYRIDPVELVVIAYLQLPAPELHRVLTSAARPLTAGGTVLFVAHDLSNLTEGVGGPQNPAVLSTGDVVASILLEAGLAIEKAGVVLRPVEGSARPARDTLVRAHTPF